MCTPSTQHVCSALAILQACGSLLQKILKCKKTCNCTPLPGRRRSGSEHHSAHLSCPSTRPRGTVTWLCLGKESTCRARNKADFPPSPPHSSRRGHVPYQAASSAGELNAVDVSFFNMHAMTCNFSGFLSQIPRPDCSETNLDQRLKALRLGRKSVVAVLAAGPNTTEPSRLPPGRTALLLRND